MVPDISTPKMLPLDLNPTKMQTRKGIRMGRGGDDDDSELSEGKSESHILR